MTKKINQSILADFKYGLDYNELGGNELGTSKKDNVTILYNWILSGQAPAANIRGRWTDLGVWSADEIWLG